MLDRIKQIADTMSPYVWGQVIKSKKNHDLYDWLLSATHNMPAETTVRERVYVVLNPTDLPYCDLGNKRRFDDKKGSYAFCGRINSCECYQKYHKQTYVPLPRETMQQILQKREATWLERYGVNNPSKAQCVKQKRKETFSQTNKEELWKKISEDKTNTGYYEVCDRVAHLVSPKFTVAEYHGSSRKNRYKWRCVACNHEFRDHVDYGRYPRCIKCYPNQSSKVERDLLEFVESLGIKAYPKSREVLKDLEYDIWIPDKKIAVEYNGVYWHSDQYKDPGYHYVKFKRSRDHGVKLIQIFEDEYKRKPHIIKNRLRAILGMASKIPARKCNIVEVSAGEYKQFVEKHHLQGYASASIKLGLSYGGRLVAIMSFSTSRYTDEGYEMIRYCSEGNVVGGASKLFKFFIQKYSPPKVISYANRCWSDGGLYEKLGFENVTREDDNVGYWYVKGSTRYHRSTFTKKRLIKLGFDSNKTESEIMQEQGFLKIFDAGNYAFEWMPESTPHSFK